MKKIPILILFFTFSCKTDDSLKNIDKDNFLVSKVYDYKDRLLADYIYNDKWQLIKRKFTDPDTGNSSDLLFSYNNLLLKKIEYIDNDFPEFNHELHLFYDDSNKVTRYETHKNGEVMSHTNLMYNSDNNVKHLHTDDGRQLNLYKYDQNFNITSTTNYFIDPRTQKEYEITNTFSYDNNKKPSFGLSKNLPIQLLPKMGGIASYEKNYSTNNMTESSESGTTWSYQYNEYGLPTSIITKWKDIETKEPMEQKIKYIEK